MPQDNVSSRLISYKKRDADKNKKTVLLNELIQFESREKYKNYHIDFLHANDFKYGYLVEKINGKEITTINDDDIRLLEYLLTHFGLYVNLVQNDILIKKFDIGDTFLDDYKKYAFRHSNIQPGYFSIWDYHQKNEQEKKNIVSMII